MTLYYNQRAAHTVASKTLRNFYFHRFLQRIALPFVQKSFVNSICAQGPLNSICYFASTNDDVMK